MSAHDSTPYRPPVALTIAGSDPSGGAGLQADLKTFHQHRVYGMSVATLLTVQNTRSVADVLILDPDIVRAQFEAVAEDIPPAAMKTGALGNAGVIRVVAECAARVACPLVVDPVMISKHGSRLLEDDAIDAMVNELLPRASLITPNLDEAAALIGAATDDLRSTGAMRETAQTIAEKGVANVLIKGGHLNTDQAIDILRCADGTFHEFPAKRVDTQHTHGTGCVYSAAISASLAHGNTLIESVQQAKAFITRAIETAPRLGGGHGPVNHFAETESRETTAR